MECPICKSEMQEGEILCPQGKFKWIPKGTKIFSKESKYFGKVGGFLGRAFIEAYYCDKCKKIIINDIY